MDRKGQRPKDPPNKEDPSSSHVRPQKMNLLILFIYVFLEIRPMIDESSVRVVDIVTLVDDRFEAKLTHFLLLFQEFALTPLRFA